VKNDLFAHLLEITRNYWTIKFSKKSVRFRSSWE
jgi:hypothetical protein